MNILVGGTEVSSALFVCFSFLFINFYVIFNLWQVLFYLYHIKKLFTVGHGFVLSYNFHSNEKIICLCPVIPFKMNVFYIFHKNMLSTLMILSMLYLFLMEKQSKTTCCERAQWHSYCLKLKSLRMAWRLWKG